MITSIIKSTDSETVGLPAAPALPGDIRQAVDRVIGLAEAEIGDPVQQDYYKCSRDRFAVLLAMTITYLPAGSTLLDIGNAPGYFAIMLKHAGYKVVGINLSDAWNATYPSPDCLKDFEVRACDIEKEALPYKDQSFDGIVFTEVLEHVAIKHPRELLKEFERVLRPGGLVIFSTPNVCNISNLVALMKGKNIFWDCDIFYGSTDRHNREYTPKEVRAVFESAQFATRSFFGINDHANWRSGAAEDIYEFLGSNPGEAHALLRNTVIGVFERSA